GYVLGWDMKAVFARKVGVEIAEGRRLIGKEIKRVVGGDGEIVGGERVRRFLAMHVFLLGAGLFGPMAGHFIM
uniref:cytochrome b N-terminal domain-containing protein n=1 Tax=Bacillus altitudinis TaxID=293387 RepID=UPI001643707A